MTIAIGRRVFKVCVFDLFLNTLSHSVQQENTFECIKIIRWIHVHICTQQARRAKCVSALYNVT